MKYRTKNMLRLTAEIGSEPARASYIKAKVLFSSDDEIAELLIRAGSFPIEDREYKTKVFYANLWLNQNY